MTWFALLAERERALAASRAARADLADAVDGVVDVYRAHPVSTLAVAAGMGFVLARLRVGGNLVRAGARIASGPAWRLVRQFLQT